MRSSRGTSGVRGRKRKNTLKLTQEDALVSITDASRSSRKTVEEKLLEPLLVGRSVILAIRDPKMPRKKRVPHPFIVMVPASQAGLPEGLLLVSIPGYGSEIIDITKPVKVVMLVRLSLSLELSSVLASAMNLVFHRGEK